MSELRVLKQGTSGTDVTQWQTFLKGQGFTPSEGGKFDDTTVQATVDFQRFHNIPPTGRVNNKTLGLAMVHGLKIVPDEEPQVQATGRSGMSVG